MSVRLSSSRRFAALVTVPVLLLGLAACSDDDPGSTRANDEVTAQPTPTPGATPAGTPTGTPTPTGKETKGAKSEPDDPEASGTGKPIADPVVGDYTPIKRGGKSPKPTVTAAPVPFDKVVSYSDGLRLDITKVEQGKVEGQGPGVIVGAPTTAVAMTMTNNSSKTVSLTGVVATMLYGPDGRQARPIYDNDSARDFTGSLKPGASTKAVYIFSVPRAELDSLAMYIDFDGIHTVAQFEGSLK